MKRSFVLTIYTLCFALSFPSLGNTAKLDRVEGCRVTDFLTGKPIAGVKVIATTSSDLIAEQRHLKYETITDKNGKYSIKGLAGKSYSINLIKDGYQSAISGVSISREGAKICRNEDKLFLNLPHSNSEYSFYDPFNKKVTKNIGRISKLNTINNGYGDIHYYYDRSIVEQIDPVQSPSYLLRVYDTNNGSNTSWCTTPYISRLLTQGDYYEVAENNSRSFNILKMEYIYSYQEDQFFKALYRLPYITKGYYALGNSFDCSGGSHVVNIRDTKAISKKPVDGSLIIGSWGGEVKQGTETYPISMAISQTVIDSVAGKVDYPTLQCGGTITLIEADSGRFVFEEKIEYGRNKCVDGGTVHLRAVDRKIIFEWSYPDGRLGAVSTLDSTQ